MNNNAESDAHRLRLHCDHVQVLVPLYYERG